MNTLYLAASLSFLAGVAGFVMARFWVIPIAKYLKIKRQILIQLTTYLQSLKKANESDPPPPDGEARAGLRVLSAALKDIHDLDLPPWYRMILRHRSELPESAAVHLMKLADTRHPDHAAKRAILLAESLKLPRDFLQ